MTAKLHPYMALTRGIEPRLGDPQSPVLPLDDASMVAKGGVEPPWPAYGASFLPKASRGAATGSRTPVAGLRSPSPRPLDDRRVIGPPCGCRSRFARVKAESPSRWRNGGGVSSALSCGSWHTEHRISLSPSSSFSATSPFAERPRQDRSPFWMDRGGETLLSPGGPRRSAHKPAFVCILSPNPADASVLNTHTLSRRRGRRDN